MRQRPGPARMTCSFAVIPCSGTSRRRLWFAEIASRESAIAALQAHIRQMCSHFKGSMQSWDVINEPIQTSGRSGMLRKSVFTEKIGPEFLDIAFHTAREADSKALLTLNEYGTEYNIPDHLRKRRELLNL